MESHLQSGRFWILVRTSLRDHCSALADATCISCLVLLNKLPQTKCLKQHTFIISHSFYESEIRAWFTLAIFFKISHETAIKVLPKAKVSSESLTGKDPHPSTHLWFLAGSNFPFGAVGPRTSVSCWQLARGRLAMWASPTCQHASAKPAKERVCW